MSIDFCVPVYNEDAIFLANAKKILYFLQNQGLAAAWRLVFIVNGSTLSFQTMVQSFADQNKAQVLCFIVEKDGKGRAIRTYFDASCADILVYMDIDLAVDLNDLNCLLAPVLSGEVDLCFGSRMLPASIRTRSWYREWSSRAYLYLSRFLLKHNFTDLQCGFKAIKSQAWRQLSLLIRDNAWFFGTELIYFAQQRGLVLREIPVNWSENRYSYRRSKIKVWQQAWVFFKKTVNLRYRALSLKKANNINHF